MDIEIKIETFDSLINAKRNIDDYNKKETFGTKTRNLYIYIFRLENNRERTLQRKDRYRDYKKYIQRNIELKIKIDVQLMRR